MSLTSSSAEPQPSLAWQFQSSNVDSVTGLTPSAQVSPGPAQLQGSAALVTNAPTSNTAVYFPGTTGAYMDLGTNSPINFNLTTSNIFVECWIYLNSGVDYPAVIGVGSPSQTPFPWHWQLSFNGTSSNPRIGINYNTYNLNSSIACGFQTWKHVAFSYVPGTSTVYIFVDGQSGGSMTAVEVANVLTEKTLIGTYTNFYSFANMYIRDLRVVQGGVVPVAQFTPLASAPFSYASPTYVANMGTTVFTLLGQFITYNPSGKYGSAVSITNYPVNGYTATSYIRYPLATPISVDNGFTTAFWFKPAKTPPSGEGYAITFNGSAGTFTVYFVYNSSSKLAMVFYDANFKIPPVTSYTAGTWYHIAGTILNGLVSFYVNGSLIGTAGYVPSGVTVNTQFYVGSAAGYGGADILMDDLRIYNTALTASQVQSVYSSQGAPAPSRAMPLPKLAWDFNGTTAPYIGTVTSTAVNGTITYGTGKYAQDIIMNGTSNIVYNIPDQIVLDTGFTIAFWLKPLNVTTAGWIYDISATNYGDRLYASIQTNGYLSFVYLGFAFYSPYPLSVGTWYHITVTLVAGMMTLYWNGTYSAQSAQSTTGVILANKLSIAALVGGQGPNINAEYDDLRIFDRALTSAQVQSIYNQQGVPGRGVLVPQYIKSATGGNTVQDIGGYRIHTFTTVGTSTFTPASAGNVEVLVVAGGGGGGSGKVAFFNGGGGGGAGELIYNSSFTVSGAVSVTVGNGGAIVNGPGGNGENSSFGSLTGIGGGGGGSNTSAANRNGRNGGSGGGGSKNGAGGLALNTTGMGNAGASWNTLLSDSGTGGGGAVSAGLNSSTNAQGGPGGTGFASVISGASVVYASGGAGGARDSNESGVSALPNTGSGGGGGGGNADTSGGAGGSGIVIVRYPLPIRLTGTPLFTQLSPSATSSAVGAFSLRAVNGQSTGGTARAVQVRRVPSTAGTSAIQFSIIGNQFSRTDASPNPPDTSVAGQVTYNGTNQYTRINSLNLTPTTTGMTVSLNFKLNSAASGQTILKIFDSTFTNSSLQVTYNGTGFILEGTSGGTYYNLNFYSATSGTNYYIVFVFTGTTIYTYINNVLWSTKTISQALVNDAAYYVWGIGADNSPSAFTSMTVYDFRIMNTVLTASDIVATDFYADRLGNLLTAPVTGQSLANWLWGATGYVTTWYDQSGRGKDATQTTAALQPKIDLVNKQIDFKPSAYFNLPDGTVPSGNSNYTMTLRHNTVGTLSCMIGSGTYGTTNGVNALEWNTSEGYNNFWWGNDVKTSSLVTNTAGNIVTAKYNNTIGRTIYVNGTSIITGDTTNRNSTTIQNTIGTDLRSNQGQGANHPMNGELYYIFLFNTALSDTDRTLVESLPIT